MAIVPASPNTFESPRDDAERNRYRAVQFTHGPRFRTYRHSGQIWFGFSAVGELDGLPPEILLIPLAGPTRGHAGVAVDTGDGWLLHAGDSYFFHGEVDPGQGPLPTGTGHVRGEGTDRRGPRLDNQRRLPELVRAHADGVTVFSSHSAVEFHRLSRRSMS